MMVIISCKISGQVTVEFKGNERTKASFLNQILDIEAVDSIDVVQARIQRLINLPTIVDARIDSVAEDKVIVQIEEGLTTIPIVNFGRIEGNRWFQFGVTELNLFGRSIQGTAFYLNNQGEHNGYLSIRVPYLFGSKWGVSLEAQRYASIEPLYFPDTYVFRYRNNTVGGTIIRELSYRHQLEVGGNYLAEDYRYIGEEAAPDIVPRKLEINKWLGKLIHRYNRIDRHHVQFAGWAIQQHAQAIRDTQGDYSPFYIYWTDFRFFHRFVSFGGNFATRVKVGVSSNEASPFAPFVLDSQMNIRGVGNRVDRGTAVAVINLEYRQKIFEYHRFAGQLVGFTDIGNWRSPGGNFDHFAAYRSLTHFAGGGIRVIWTRSNQAVLRLDYGVDCKDASTRGLVIGLGHFF